MAKQEIYPADTVDSEGKAWPTVGENIRNGSHSNFYDEVYNILNLIFPVGCIYYGEPSAYLKRIFTWDNLTLRGGGRGFIINDLMDGDTGWIDYEHYSLVLSNADYEEFKKVFPTIKQYRPVRLPVFRRIK